jgi:hypothetical protein
MFVPVCPDQSPYPGHLKPIAQVRHARGCFISEAILAAEEAQIG